MATTLISGVQYSGIWTLQQAHDAIAASNWPIGSPQFLFSWGNPAPGTYTSAGGIKSSPVQVGSEARWNKLSGGRNSSFFIKTDGSLFGFGTNDLGQLGLGNLTYQSNITQIGALTTWANVEGSWEGAYAIKTGGTLWAWGSGTYGQLGLGNITSYSSPVQVGLLTDWLQVVGGYHCAWAIKTDGTLWSWAIGFRYYCK